MSIVSLESRAHVIDKCMYVMKRTTARDRNIELTIVKYILLWAVTKWTCIGHNPD